MEKERWQDIKRRGVGQEAFSNFFPSAAHIPFIVIIILGNCAFVVKRHSWWFHLSVFDILLTSMYDYYVFLN